MFNTLRRRAALLAAAVALPLTVLLVLLLNQGALDDAADPDPTDAPSTSAATTTATPPPPVDVEPPPDSAAADQSCPALVAELPITLAGLPARATNSDSNVVGAWGDPAVVFRCGVDRPAALEPTSELTVVNGVQWLTEPAGDHVTYTAVDRPVYVELVVPLDYDSGSVNGVSTAIANSLPAAPVDAEGSGRG